MAVLPIKNESRAMLWPKTKLAWLYTYKHYLDKADWYVIVWDGEEMHANRYVQNIS